jgi:hypothetical protein
MMIIAVGPVTGSSRMRYQDHIGIVEAIRSGDTDAVRAEISRHMTEFAAKYIHDYAVARTES